MPDIPEFLLRIGKNKKLAKNFGIIRNYYKFESESETELSPQHYAFGNTRRK